MIDAFRPATLLLATLCLWAVLVLAMALGGLGGRLAPSPEPKPAASSVPSLALRPIAARLGPVTDYLEVGARPLLQPDRRPAPVLAAEGGAGDFDASLTSVLITPRLQLAIFTDNEGGASRRVKVGETVAGTNWRLVQLEPRRAVLEGPGGQRSLDLRVFDGKGGAAAPAAPATPPAAGDEAPAAPVATAADAGNATPKPEPKTEPVVPTQEEQVEAIRRRIEARRAQMRADAARAAEDKR